jgi:hypothetical protein
LKKARETAEQEARVAKEVDVRESVSRLLGEIAKELPAAKKQPQPSKK